ncbi:MAG: hypothetical protein ACFFBD_24330 [Candidatus Hodarchaeota archaeon]
MLIMIAAFSLYFLSRRVRITPRKAISSHIPGLRAIISEYDVGGNMLLRSGVQPGEQKPHQMYPFDQLFTWTSVSRQ